MKRLFGRCLVQGFITGNLVSTTASQFGKTLQSMLEVKSISCCRRRCA